jgi:DNA-binding NarL/FixJ family response regulator
MTPHRVLIADDHELVRRAVRQLIESEPGLEVCGEAANGREAVRQTAGLQPDLVVLDIGMPELNGLEAIRQIKHEQPRTEVLVLTLHESEQLVHDVLAAGARGFVLKSDAADRLLAAARALLGGDAYLTPRVETMVLAGYLGHERRGTASPAPAALTAREREIVQMLAEGHSNKQVAATLCVSQKTVETHRANIMRKLDLHSLAELVHYAIRNGIVVA